MRTGLVFHPGERGRIDACHDAADAAAQACGLAMPTRGEVHAQFHRWLIRRVRRGAGARPRHAEMAALLLDWCRAQGMVELFALCPQALAIARLHGDAGLSAAADRHPGLRHAWSLLDALPGTNPGSGAGTAAGAPAQAHRDAA